MKSAKLLNVMLITIIASGVMSCIQCILFLFFCTADINTNKQDSLLV